MSANEEWTPCAWQAYIHPMAVGDVPNLEEDPRGGRQTAPPELNDEEKRRWWGLENVPEARGPYLIELNVHYVDGLSGAANALVELFHRTIGEPEAADDAWGLTRISKTYYCCDMAMREWKTLITADEMQAEGRAQDARSNGIGSSCADAHRFRAIYKLWPDFSVNAQ